DSGWLEAGAGALERDAELAAVTGQVIMPRTQPPTDYERNEAGLETAEFVTANCFCRRSVLEMLDGFDERFTSAWREDSDLHFRLLERGAKLMKAPAAVVVHPVRPASWGISLRMQRKSQFDALLYKKHPSLYRQHIWRLPPLDYYAIVLSFVAALVATALGAWIVCVLAIAMWMALMGRFLGRRLRGTSHAPAHIPGNAHHFLVHPVSIGLLAAPWRRQISRMVLLSPAKPRRGRNGYRSDMTPLLRIPGKRNDNAPSARSTSKSKKAPCSGTRESSAQPHAEFSRIPLHQPDK